MKLLKPRTFIIFALAGLSGVALLHTSQNVQRAEDKARALEASIAREQEQIRMLKAEWMHLNRPERLEKLANEFLDLVPPAPQNILREASGAFPDPEIEAPNEAEARPVSYDAPLTARSPARKPSVKPQISPRYKPSALKSSAKKSPKDFNSVLDGLTQNRGDGAP